jgi:hypothetical protein
MQNWWCLLPIFNESKPLPLVQRGAITIIFYHIIYVICVRLWRKQILKSTTDKDIYADIIVLLTMLYNVVNLHVYFCFKFLCINIVAQMTSIIMKMFISHPITTVWRSLWIQGLYKSHQIFIQFIGKVSMQVTKCIFNIQRSLSKSLVGLQVMKCSFSLTGMVFMQVIKCMFNLIGKVFKQVIKCSFSLTGKVFMQVIKCMLNLIGKSSRPVYIFNLLR